MPPTATAKAIMEHLQHQLPPSNLVNWAQNISSIYIREIKTYGQPVQAVLRIEGDTLTINGRPSHTINTSIHLEDPNLLNTITQIIQQ